MSVLPVFGIFPHCGDFWGSGGDRFFQVGIFFTSRKSIDFTFFKRKNPNLTFYWWNSRFWIKLSHKKAIKMVWRVISNFMPTFIPRLVPIKIFFEKNKWGFFRKLWGSLKKVGIFSKNVGIFEKKNGGDMWGFLIDEVGNFDYDHLETLPIHGIWTSKYFG